MLGKTRTSEAAVGTTFVLTGHDDVSCLGRGGFHNRRLKIAFRTHRTGGPGLASDLNSSAEYVIMAAPCHPTIVQVGGNEQ